ncbi:hypothetical protein JW935_13225 [candidate division KSB1 bacterium]|nr:hypothetical protein [candidate division KSB1 bacterium]
MKNLEVINFCLFNRIGFCKLGKIKSITMKITIDVAQFRYDVNYLKSIPRGPYINVYPEFINYFRLLSKIEKHHLVISSHFVYGWMPTILKLDLKKCEKILEYLNDAKAGKELNHQEISEIKDCVNHSMVGTSKLLHFVNPDLYAIWDSRVCNYFIKSNFNYQVNNIATYQNYLDELRILAVNDDFKVLHKQIDDYCQYPVSSLRAIELVIFEASKNSQHK